MKLLLLKLNILLALALTGCSEDVKPNPPPGNAVPKFGLGGFNPNAPPPGELHRKQVMEQGLYGAASIEELRSTYLKAHQAKDMQMVRHMFGWNVGTLNVDHSRPLWSGATHPSELAIAQLFEIPIRDVELLARMESKYSRKIAFYCEREGGKAKRTSIGGRTRGRLVLIAEDGRRIDPFFAVLEYYGKRFVMNTDRHVVEDAVEAHLKNRPPVWLPVPMDPQTPEEKALVLRLFHY
ncbi:MAG: hypothetical protein KDA68_04105 [Planctomycetaceae bacterium]|nr:hypothetical protein [Planctomycetaceae bacterium]